MMAITRFDRYRDFGFLQDRLNRVFHDFSGRANDTDVMTTGSWVPAVDILRAESGDAVLTAELPGMTRDEIDLRVENSTLTLKGDRKFTKDVSEEQFHRIERSYGSFSRSFSLPDTIDAAQVRADFKDGLLTVTMPIREERKPKQIQVEIAS